ncbi:hypothetical protein SAMN04489760_10724 [Syntrophus gentianae]|uniref:Uncharacterized protein n=1 Tax=Syntrophus gentianae TaxID=43775 RepID=A0A1H7WL32_9BACT|nr:hypothetical protein SAMN04489760_10724 [Syntrophus gentianae]
MEKIRLTNQTMDFMVNQALPWMIPLMWNKCGKEIVRT